jgi:hypothetical protein
MLRLWSEAIQEGYNALSEVLQLWTRIPYAADNQAATLKSHAKINQEVFRYVHKPH